MGFKITRDIRSITDLKRHTKDILLQAHETKEPIILTVNGKADAVIMSAEAYQEKLEKAEVLLKLAQGESDIAAGHAQDFNQFIKGFMYERDISD